MSAQPVIADRPFLRLYNPEDPPESRPEYTMQLAFDAFRWPDLQQRKSASDGTRWMRLWGEFEAELCAAQRTPSPLRIKDIGSKELKAFQLWLQEPGRFPPPKGASSVNKAIKEVTKVLSLAADEGIEVQRVRPPRHMRTTTRPRYYFDDAAVEQLWRAAGSLAWPPARVAKPRKGTVFVGSGVEPADFWRSLFILLRNYGMRVQDLVAYAARKRPLMWGDVHFDARSPNPESLETWPLGWLYYRAAKTADSSGKEYYLPMTVSARAAIDRLRAGAQQLHGQRIPSDAPVFCCPKSHGLTAGFKALQKLAGVATRSGEPYELEDFRKTVATYSATVDGDLPHALCGWGPGGGVKTRHYQQPEPLLVRKLHQVPLPSCFAEWTNPAHAEAVAAFAAAL